MTSSETKKKICWRMKIKFCYKMHQVKSLRSLALGDHYLINKSNMLVFCSFFDVYLHHPSNILTGSDSCCLYLWKHIQVQK